MKLTLSGRPPRLTDLAAQTGVAVEKLAEVVGVDAASSEQLDAASLEKLQAFLDTRGPVSPVAGGASAGGLLRMGLEAQLPRAAPQEPTTVEPDLVEVQPLRAEPNLAVADLGGVGTLAQWIDQHYGNRNGAIGRNELQRFARDHGHEPQHHAGIKELASRLRARTREVNGRIEVLGPDKGAGTASASSTAPAASSNESRQIAGRLVKRVGSATQSDVDKVANILASAPLAALRSLEQRNYQVRVCGVISEARPDLRGRGGRGFPPGATFDTAAAGLHDVGRREIIIPKRGIATHYILHEVGHAFDHARGLRSRSNDYRQAYEGARPALQRNREHYLLQPGEAGLSESYADSFSLYNDPRERNEFKREYPSLYNYWRAQEQAGWA